MLSIQPKAFISLLVQSHFQFVAENLAEFEFLNFSRQRSWKLVDNHQVARNLEVSHASLAELSHIGACERPRRVLEANEGADLFTHPLVGDA